MGMTTSTPTAYPTTATVPAGHPVHISAQTASRDYTAHAVGGTYPVEYTTVNYHPVPDGERPYYALVRLPVVSPQRSQPSVIVGGVAMASETIAESTHDHILVMYAYEVQGKAARGALELHY
jgi:hypothetical protein